MRIPIRRQVWLGGLALVGLGVLVLGGQEAFAWWQTLRARQEQVAARMARVQGWVDVAPEVAARAQDLFGAAPVAPAAVLEGLSQQAALAGVRVVELKPGPKAVELGLEGSPSALGGYLRAIAAHRPPLKVEAVSFLSQPKPDAPVLMRVRVRAA